MKQALIGFLLLATALIAQDLPKTNRVMAFVDLTDPAHPRTELVFAKPAGGTFRAPLEEMTKQLQAGNHLVTIDEFNRAVDQHVAQYNALLDHDNKVVANYNALASQFNDLMASNRTQQQQQRRQAIATWMMLQQSQPSATQPMQDLIRSQQQNRIHCMSSTLGNYTNTDCQ